MNKYINIEIAKKYLRHDSYSNPYFRSQACQQAINILDIVPAADVVEVRYGKWINAYPEIEPNPMFMYGICSVCGFEQSVSDKLKYCPNCGAKMEGGKNE